MKIAVVIPVFQESQNLFKLYTALKEVTQALPDISWCYVFVNDGSPDDSLVMLAELARRDKRVKVLDLSRNFGKEIALTAGVHMAAEADVEAVICMDADLQHPPTLIPQLVAAWQGGAEIVVTIRTSIEKQPWLRQLGSYSYYWLMDKLSGLEMRSQTTDYRLFDKKVVAAFCQATERERMFRGIMDWLGFRKIYVEFQAGPREDGVSGYSYAKLWQLAVSSITAFSLFPLRLTGYLGIFITITSLLLLVWMLVNYFFYGIFTPLGIVVVINTFLIGIVLIAIGLVALYIGHIHTEVINRPLYVVRERINC